MPITLQSTVIVVPAFNEEATVGAVVDEVFAKLPGVSCLVVDDCSSDRTAAEAIAAGATVLRLPFNLGVGGAMRAGFRWALEHNYECVVQVDADGQHDPASVPLLLETLSGGADLAIGARFAGEGSYTVSGPRKWAMKFLAAVLSSTTRTTLTDTTSGNRASAPRAIALFANHYPAEYLGDTIESLVIAARSGLVIRQVPVVMRPRAGGVPSQNFVRSTVYLARGVLALMFALMRPKSSYGAGARS